MQASILFKVSNVLLKVIRDYLLGISKLDLNILLLNA
jgi:hypothetical protein